MPYEPTGETLGNSIVLSNAGATPTWRDTGERIGNGRVETTAPEPAKKTPAKKASKPKAETTTEAPEAPDTATPADS